MKENKQEPSGHQIPPKDLVLLSAHLLDEQDANKHQAVLIDNEAIIRQVIKENPQGGYEMIFKRYYKPLCSHAIRFVYSKEVAEDLVSDVFLNFWKMQLYKTVTSSYRAYLYTAVRNNCYNYLKKEFKELSVNEKESAEKREVVDISNPQSILLFDELFYKMEQSIKTFSPQCQKVFLLSRFEGKKNREIAEELQIKLKTVEAHMMKALATLKKSLTDYLK